MNPRRRRLARLRRNRRRLHAEIDAIASRACEELKLALLGSLEREPVDVVADADGRSVDVRVAIDGFEAVS